MKTRNIIEVTKEELTVFKNFVEMIDYQLGFQDEQTIELLTTIANHEKDFYEYTIKYID